MNTLFDNMLVRATVNDMLERAAETRANRKAEKSGGIFKSILLAATPIAAWLLWTLFTG